MTEIDVIARQAVKIETIEADNERMRQALQDAKLHIVCVGGPLNDNKLGYSKEQMWTFQRILDAVEDGLCS